MLTRSFVHVPGIGRATERKLWDAGIRSWEDFLSRAYSAPIGDKQREVLCRAIEQSVHAIQSRDWMFFYRALPSADQWRMLNLPHARIGYLDIETTGLSPTCQYITCIGVYDGAQVHSYVRGQNLEQFVDDIEQYDLLVTYNGKCFDLPFIRAAMGIALDVPHVDLRYVSASVGLKGGLKGAEKRAGIRRPHELEGVDGYMAVLLWSEYERTGDERALETLVAYNAEDVINLLPLAQAVWNRKLPNRFRNLRVERTRSRPALPQRADGELVRRLLREAGMGSW